MSGTGGLRHAQVVLTRRWLTVAGFAGLAACASTPAPPPEPVYRCREIPNALVECEVDDGTAWR